MGWAARGDGLLRAMGGGMGDGGSGKGSNEEEAEGDMEMGSYSDEKFSYGSRDEWQGN